MDPTDLKTLLEKALRESEPTICNYIDNLKQGSTKGIEKIFLASLRPLFISELKHEIEVSVRMLDGKNPVTESGNGAIDDVLYNSMTGIEFKAIRLPRLKSLGSKGTLFDIGQLSADYMKITNARALKNGYVVAFLYGPLVEDAATLGQLYRSFHNHSFVDFVSTPSKVWLETDKPFRPAQKKVIKKLGWHKPHVGTKVPSGIVVAQSRRLAAIAWHVV